MSRMVFSCFLVMTFLGCRNEVQTKDDLNKETSEFYQARCYLDSLMTYKDFDILQESDSPPLRPVETWCNSLPGIERREAKDFARDMEKFFQDNPEFAMQGLLEIPALVSVLNAVDDYDAEVAKAVRLGLFSGYCLNSKASDEERHELVRLAEDAGVDSKLTERLRTVPNEEVEVQLPEAIRKAYSDGRQTKTENKFAKALFDIGRWYEEQWYLAEGLPREQW